jgi:hypothetical protein
MASAGDAGVSEHEARVELAAMAAQLAAMEERVRVMMRQRRTVLIWR